MLSTTTLWMPSAASSMPRPSGSATVFTARRAASSTADRQHERRLGRIHDLARKHRLAPAELAAHRDGVAAELQRLRGAGERLDRLDDDIAAARTQWSDAAAALGATRRRAAAQLGDAVTALIAELGMGGGTFRIELEPAVEARPDPNGAERAEFLVAANAGQPPRAMRKVASGGELEIVPRAFAARDAAVAQSTAERIAASLQ